MSNASRRGALAPGRHLWLERRRCCRLVTALRRRIAPCGLVLVALPAPMCIEALSPSAVTASETPFVGAAAFVGVGLAGVANRSSSRSAGKGRA